MKIINENNENLLEKIYKNQTVSNFNNKYNLKYNSNNCKKRKCQNIIFFNNYLNNIYHPFFIN